MRTSVVNQAGKGLQATGPSVPPRGTDLQPTTSNTTHLRTGLTAADEGSWLRRVSAGRTTGLTGSLPVLGGVGLSVALSTIDGRRPRGRESPSYAYFRQGADRIGAPIRWLRCLTLREHRGARVGSTPTPVTWGGRIGSILRD